jgi:hypothetical protein
MKKGKLLSILTAAVVVVSSLGFSAPVYATSRTETTEVLGVSRSLEETPQVLGAKRSSDLGAGVSVGNITDKNALNSLYDLEMLAKIISAYTGKTVTASEISILDMMDINHDEGTEVSEEIPLFITFSFPAITVDSEVYVFHYGKNGWEIVPSTVSEGQIVGEFTSLSPVAIVAKTSTLNGAVLGANRSKSARTGDYRMVYFLACIAVLGMAGFAIKKKAI